MNGFVNCCSTFKNGNIIANMMKKSNFLLLTFFLSFCEIHSFENQEVYNIELRPYDMKGWNLYESFFEPLLQTNKINVVIEVGCFFGNWTAFIAERLPEGGKIYAVDHFQGS